MQKNKYKDDKRLAWKKIVSVKTVATEGMFMFSYVEILTPQGKGISRWCL